MRKLGYLKVERKIDVKREVEKLLKYEDLKDEDLIVDVKNNDNIKILKENLEEGDTLYLKSIFHLGKNYKEILNNYRNIILEKKIDLIVIDIPMLNTLNMDKNLLLSFTEEFLAALYKNNLKIRRAKQKEGILKAKEDGIMIGRPPIESESNEFIEEIEKWRKGEQSAVKTYKKLGISKSSFYRIINKKS